VHKSCLSALALRKCDGGECCPSDACAGGVVAEHTLVRIGEQSQWLDVPGGQWPRLEFCKNDAQSGAAPSCYKKCKSPATPKCCQGVGFVCSDAQPCCAGVAISCLRGVCQYDARQANATIAFDTTALSTEEGPYELRAVSYCSGDLETGSDIVPGRIDRTPPRPFGTGAEPADKLWWPGDEISMTFTEDVQCDRPFRFATTIEVDGVRANVSNPVDVICEKTKVRFAFSRTLVQMSDAFVGKQVTVHLANVPDLALNTAAAEVSWAFTVGAFALDKASVTLTDVRVPLAITSGERDVSGAVARALLGANGPLAQITVTPTMVAPMRKRQASSMSLTESFNVQVKSAEESGVRDAPGALTIANTILKQPTIDTSETQVAISAPGDPGALMTQASSDEAPFFESTLGIVVIVIIVLLALVLIAVIVGVIVCVAYRRRGSAQTAASPSSSAPTRTPNADIEMQSDFVGKNRSVRRSVPVPPSPAYVDPMAATQQQFYPTSGSIYSALPPPLISRSSSSRRRRSSRRRASSRRRHQDNAQQQWQQPQDQGSFGRTPPPFVPPRQVVVQQPPLS
jgi:hypothetical protein